MKNLLKSVLILSFLFITTLAHATVDSTTNLKRVNGDGATLEFTFTFKVLDSEDLNVFLVNDTTYVRTTQTEGTHYSVALNANGDGGTITFVTAPAATEDLLIVGNPVLTQDADFPREGSLDEQALEAALDKSVLMNTAISERTNRSLKLKLQDPLNTTAYDGLYFTSEDDREGKILQWNDAGTEIEAGISSADLEAAETNAEAAATAAASSASAASSSASDAATSAGTATTQAAAAVVSAAAAAVSETNAAASAASVAFDWEGQWLTSTAYVGGNLVFNDGSGYICILNHTSGAGTEPGTGASWTTYWELFAQQGSAGAGTGDMLGANNLSDVVSASTAFTNIKQAASDTATGVVELATNAEAQTGTDTTRALTPANLAAVTGTTTRAGVLELATDGEAQTGTDTARAITAANLQAVTATETRKGVAELATTTECTTGTDTARVCTPAGVAAAIAGAAAGDWVLLDTQTASASATLDFTSSITAAYDNYVFIIQDVRPATDNRALVMRTSTDNGSSYDASAADYVWRQNSTDYDDAANTINVGGASATGIHLAGKDNSGSVGIGNLAAEGVSCIVYLYNPLGTVMPKRVHGHCNYSNSAGTESFDEVFGARDATANVDAVRFLMASGNITSGKIKMYGIAD